jgi:type I restriction-modification system DNA methylase subunit
MDIDYATSNITNNDDLREKIHEIHNYMRNNGIGYGLTSLKVFNLFYGLMKIEDYGLNNIIGLNDEKCKFSYLLQKSKEKDFTCIIDNILDIIYENPEVNSLIYYNIPLDLTYDVYNEILNKIESIKEIEKSSKEQLSGKIYEYFVGRDQSAISELGAYFTNRRIVNFCLDKIKPQIKSDGSIPKMIDMFGGSGGFTIGYMDYLNRNFKIDWKQELNNIYHFDINEDVLKSAKLEFFCLSGGIIPKSGTNGNIRRTNSFKQDFKNYGKFDLILTNPPYGGDKVGTSGKKEKRDKIIEYINNEIKLFKNKVIENLESFKDYKKILDDIKKPNSKIDKILKLINDIDYFKDNHDVKRIQQLYEQSNQLKKENKNEIEETKKLCVNIDSCSEENIKKFAVKYKLKGTDKEACSLMLIMDLLAIDGTAVGVLKEGLFFDSSYTDLRKVLIENFNIKEIISVPSNQFENTTTKTSIVIFKNEKEKTSKINFSELKVNLYDNDEFIEKDNRIYLKFNKGDIKDVEEIFIKSVSVNEIKSNETYSLNSKDYNKVSIECGDDFKLVRIGNICEFLPKSKKQASYGKDEGLYNFYTSSDKVKKCDEADYNNEYLIIGNGGVANIKIDRNFSCSDHNYIINSNDKYYLYYLLSSNIYLLENGFKGSTLKNLSKKYLEELEIPIPKTPELLEYWENKISKPYMKKQEKERRFKKLEEEIQNKIKDIQENHECDNVKLGDICKIYGSPGGDKLGKFKRYEYINNKDINNKDINNYGFIRGCEISKKSKLKYYILKKDYDTYYKNTNNIVITNDLLITSCSQNISYYKIPIEWNNFPYHGCIRITNINMDINYLTSYMSSKIFINNILKQQNGSVVKYSNASHYNKIIIKIPKDKSLIDNLQPLFHEFEELQKEIKELDETYNEYLQELSKSAIKNQEILNSNNDNYEETNEISNENLNETYDIDNEPITIKSETSSKKSLTFAELKEQCKSLGIKGYSKKNKEELIEMINNHK